MFPIGAQVGRYVLERKLGEGGFGVVYIARDTSLDRPVALKLLLPQHTSDRAMLGRFLREARSAARIAHPGIVTVFECGQLAEPHDNVVAFIAMELLAGESLAARISRGRMAVPVVRELGRQIASAVAAAHAAEIVHRDLKPDNIFLVRDPDVSGGERVKVLDFGIAKLASTDRATSEKTHALMVFGTPAYMSPEQCRSSTNIDRRSDIYALGCIVFEMLSGRPPFLGETGTAGELMGLHQHVAPPTLRSMGVEAPADLEALVAAMLAKTPEQRPESMDSIAAILGGAASFAANHARSTIVAGPTTPSRPTTLSAASAVSSVPAQSGRRWIYPAAAFVTVGISIAGIIAVTRPSSEASVQETATTPLRSRVPAVPAVPAVDAAVALDAAPDASLDAAIDAAPDARIVDAGTRRDPQPRIKTVPLVDAGTMAVDAVLPPRDASVIAPRPDACATDDPECVFGGHP